MLFDFDLTGNGSFAPDNLKREAVTAITMRGWFLNGNTERFFYMSPIHR